MISSFQRIHHFCGFDICGCLFILTYFLFNFSRMPVAWIYCCSFCPNSWNISLLVCQDETTFISFHGSFSLSLFFIVMFCFLFIGSVLLKRSYCPGWVLLLLLMSSLCSLPIWPSSPRLFSCYDESGWDLVSFWLCICHVLCGQWASVLVVSSLAVNRGDVVINWSQQGWTLDIKPTIFDENMLPILT